MILSILIPTLESRGELFDAMRAELDAQIARAVLGDEVEVLSLRDDGARTIGSKRNELMERARGRFVASVDDDDEVHPRYVALVAGALLDDPEVDVLGIRGEITFRGRHPRTFTMSRRFSEYRTVRGGYTRPPHHLNPIRRDIALRYPFEDVSRSEDSDWALRLARDGVLWRERMVDEVLYRYRSRRWYAYEFALNHTEFVRHPLGLQFVNRLEARRRLRGQPDEQVPALR